MQLEGIFRTQSNIYNGAFCEDKRCVDGYNLTIFVKGCIEDVRLVYEYVSAADGVSLVSKEISFFFRDVVENLHPR